MVMPASSSNRKNILSACLTVAIGLIITINAAWYSKSEAEEAALREFDFSCNEIRLNLVDRMAANAQVLNGGVALFNSSDQVTRAEWRAFVQSLQLETQLPGIQGIGFAVLVKATDLPAHLKAIRSEGFPDYGIVPAGPRALYSSIIYLEPFTGRNLRAFGYDMLTEAVRRSAMERACDENRVILSGKVTLVQETDQDVQAGTLLYAPVYRQSLPIQTVEQRRAALIGWVYSPYRMKNLMQGIMGNWENKQGGRRIVLQLYDGDSIQAADLLFDSSNSVESVPVARAPLVKQIALDCSGHRWTLLIRQPAGLAAIAEVGPAWMIGISGSLISLLIGGLLFSLRSTRVRAAQLADRLTADLRESENRYRTLIDWTPQALVVQRDGTLVYANPAAVALVGASSTSQVIGRSMMDFVHPDSRQAVLENTRRVMATGNSAGKVERKLLRLDGSVFDAELRASSIQFEGTQAIHVAFQDISQRKELADALEATKNQYDNLVSNMPVGAYILRSHPDGNFHFEFVSSRMAALLHTSVDAIRANPQVSFASIHPSDLEGMQRLNRERIQQRQPFEWEGRMLFDGETRWFRIASTPQLQPDGTMLWNGVVADITERQSQIKKIQGLLAEKELILREVHHRIKNNMNTMYSLLILQAGVARESSTVDILNDAASRLRSMMILYDKLYQSADTNAMSLARYLPVLAQEIIGTFPKCARVSIESEIEDITLPTTSLQTIGIIVNEVLTNSMKYAFADREAGRIRIAARKREGLVRLEIADDGIGMPDSLDYANSDSFGLMLVRLLAQQMQATLDMDGTEGTRVTLEIPEWPDSGR